MASISGMQDDEQVMRDVREGAYPLVLFTPEMLLQSTKWREMLLNNVYTCNLKALVVDEALQSETGIKDICYNSTL